MCNKVDPSKHLCLVLSRAILCGSAFPGAKGIIVMTAYLDSVFLGGGAQGIIVLTAYWTVYFQGAQGIIVITAYLHTVYFQVAQGIIVETAYLYTVYF